MTHLPCYYLLEKAGWLEARYFLNDLKLAVQHISLCNTFNNIQTKQRHKSSVFRLIINNSHKGPWQTVTVSNFLRIIINNKTRSCSHCLLTNYYWKEKCTKFLHSFYISHLFFPGGREKKKPAIFSLCKQLILTKHDQICCLNIPQADPLRWILSWHLMQFKTFQLPEQPY